MKNEQGMILPLTLAISFIIALLLLHFAYRIENQVRTYELEQQHFILSILEKECLATIIDELSDAKILPQAITCHQKKLPYTTEPQLFLRIQMDMKNLM